MNFRFSRICTGLAIAAATAFGQSGHWVGTWATAPVVRAAAASQNDAPQSSAKKRGPRPLEIHNQTLREIVHTSIGGTHARIVLTNVFGTAPLEVGAASIALRDKDAKIEPASKRALTFGGQTSVVIPPGAILFSDAVEENVPAMGDLAIDLFLPGDLTATPLTIHAGASQTNYISQPGDFAGAADLPVESTQLSWAFLSRVEVQAPEQAGAIVFFGDSITDGTRSTPNTNARWPDDLARRLLAKPAPAGELAVLNEAIAGNRLLADSTNNFGINALARFDRDVLAQSGAKYVVVLEGINDIGGLGGPKSPEAAAIIEAHRQLIERAHEHGLKIFGATLTPFEGAMYFTPEGETKRQAVNAFIRTGKAYDGVIDFDAVTRDPQHPAKYLAAYDSGDHLHPNDAGYLAMANSIDLKLFTSAGRRKRK